MKFELFSKLYDEAQDYADIDLYIAERGWQDWMDQYENGSDATLISDILKRIYSLAHMDIGQMRVESGLSFNSFSKVYSIPSRTIQAWEYGQNRTPEYFHKLVAYTLFAGGPNE